MDDLTDKEKLLQQIDDWRQTMLEKESLPPEPLAMTQLLNTLNKKRVPYAVIYLTEKDKNRVVNFASTMGQDYKTMQFLKEVLEKNTVYPPDEVE